MPRYFADRFDADGKFYVFDGGDNGFQAAGPFMAYEDAERHAKLLEQMMGVVVTKEEDGLWQANHDLLGVQGILMERSTDDVPEVWSVQADVGDIEYVVQGNPDLPFHDWSTVWAGVWLDRRAITDFDDFYLPCAKLQQFGELEPVIAALCKEVPRRVNQ